ncbi:N-formylglutamate amidohydrolase [Actinocrinis puniceicyclus]|uniref:N-formylglutamate amidohydrolase n=1 Tax=Actinocrinis puniceicyclus TaxID=977794 RepID=A0A8J8BF17_9ACTN|nr:N-formylglutamate amidohydrolase [Actinocrinis puniceicyclus]MBS2966175.1 N-formylglutamate amidohydrolase [Actinocrinis puniceicyclus]
MSAHTHYQVWAGSEHSSVVLHVPHGSRRIPGSARAGILLDDAALEAELDRMTDAETGTIAVRAAEAAARRPWIFENRVSRLVADPERFPDEREEMRAVGMGAVYTRTAHGLPLRREDAQEEQRLLAEYFHPYTHAMTRLVDDRLAASGRVVILDVHSYPEKPLPYELHPAGARPDVCLGTDALHTPGWLLEAARAAFADYGAIELDTPFAGCYVPQRHFGSQPAVSALMVELRRDTYSNAASTAKAANVLNAPAARPAAGGPGRPAAALARLIDLCEQNLSRSEQP